MCCWIAAVFQSRSSSILLICRIVLYLPLFGILRVYFEFVVYKVLRSCNIWNIEFMLLFFLTIPFLIYTKSYMDVIKPHKYYQFIILPVFFFTQYIQLFEQRIFAVTYNLDQFNPFDLPFKVVPLCLWGKTKKNAMFNV